MLKRVLVIICIILTVICYCNIVSFSSEDTSSTQEVGPENDGNIMDDPRKYQAPIEPSIEGCNFYDTYNPYNVSAEEMGGYTDYTDHIGDRNQDASEMIGGKGAAEYENTQLICLRASGWVMDKIYFGENFDGCQSYEEINNISKHLKFGNSDNTCEDENGNKYYIAALPTEFIYKPFVNSGQLTNYISSNTNGETSNPVMVDIILTDDTIIHFIIGDTWSWGLKTPEASLEGGYWHNFASAYGDGIEHLEHSVPCPYALGYYTVIHPGGLHQIELWPTEEDYGAIPEFLSMYGFGDGEGDNRISYFRVYDWDWDKNGAPTRTNGTEVATKGNGSSQTKERSDDESVSIGQKYGYIDEEDLTGMPKSDPIAEAQEKLSLPTKDGLSSTELDNISLIKTNSESAKYVSIMNAVRVALVFIGIALMLYAVLLILALIFDRVNVWINISLVNFLTLGKVNVTSDEIKSQGYVSFKKFIIVDLVLFFLGAMIVAGCVIPVIYKLIAFFGTK